MSDFFLKLALWEKGIFFLINKNIKNKIFDIISPFITRLGEDLTLLIIFAVVFLLGKRKTKINILLSAISVFLARVSVQILKNIFNRPRPFFIYRDVDIFTNIPTPSFPSGHTTLAFAATTVFFYKYRRFRWLLIILAILVGLSRVYMGLHYPSDIFAGALLGSFIGICILYLEKKLIKFKEKPM